MSLSFQESLLTFAEQGGGDPAGFIHACKHFCPDVEALLLRPGEGFTVHN
jgi:hypothetical protein